MSPPEQWSIQNRCLRQKKEKKKSQKDRARGVGGSNVKGGGSAYERQTFFSGPKSHEKERGPREKTTKPGRAVRREEDGQGIDSSQGTPRYYKAALSLFRGLVSL